MTSRDSLDRVSAKIAASTPPVVVFGVGIPGSGKSTLLDTIGAEFSTTPINIDNYRNRLMALNREGGGILDRLDYQVDSEVSRHIMQGGVAMIDSTNCYPEMRTQAINRYRTLGARTLGAVWMDTPIELAIERDAGRERKSRVGEQTIRVMQAALSAQSPSGREGFDWIVRIAN